MGGSNDKEHEREELQRAIWEIACELRGSVDGWDFKQYVLGMLFYRYISENIDNYITDGEMSSGDKDFRYRNITDDMAENIRRGIVQEKGFFILPSELFCNVRARAPSDENLNITLKNVFYNIEHSASGTRTEKNLDGLFGDMDVNSPKLGGTMEERRKRLVRLLDAVGDMQLGDYKDNQIDAFGDAYEYLMTMYASNAGKSGGEFYTPQEVSELLAELTIAGSGNVSRVYDGACGSGSLLLKFAKILGAKDVQIYGQEINLTTYNLCRINMMLHDVPLDNFHITHGDTLTHPAYKDMTILSGNVRGGFDAVVSNPPYSIKWAGKTSPILINDDRFACAGVLAPTSKADLAFVLHDLSYLSASGTAAIVCFPGVLYRGGAEKAIREYLVKENFVDCVIALPENLFFGTSIATAIMVLKRGKSDSNVLFIDASGECVKVTNSSKLTPDNIERITGAYKKRETKDGFAALVTGDDVLAAGSNLSVSNYVKKEEAQSSPVDIAALNKSIEEIAAREEEARREIKKIIEEMGE